MRIRALQTNRTASVLAWHSLAGAAAILAAMIVARPGLGALQTLLVVALIGGLLLSIPTEVFLAGSLLFIGAMQAADDVVVAVGPASLYASDGLIALVAVRASMPKPRHEPYRFAALTRMTLGLLGVIALIGVLRASLAGVPLVSALRAAQGFGYWLILYWGYSRLFRERQLRLGVVLRLSILVGLVLVLYLYLMTVLDRPFEAPGETALGQVVTSSGDILRRDYGFYSAFIFYPTIALLGMSNMLYARRNFIAWGLFALLGVSATLTTLIRGQILGLAAGFLVLLVLGRGKFMPQRVARPNRARVAIVIGGCVATAALGLSATNPSYALALIQRAVPVLEQSDAAVQTAELRETALTSAVEHAERHPFGIGFLSVTALIDRGLDPELIEHSLPAAVLYYLGWPALLCIATLFVLLARESRLVPAAAPWLHPFFVSTLVMMALYGFGATGLFRQPFVIGLGAYVLAARFSARGDLHR
jgi:hypothetical protein